MIIDRLENWKLYFVGKDWDIVSDFLTSLNVNTPEGEYHLKSDQIYAKVLSYETLPQEHASFEAHRQYIDIQTVLIGAEGIAWQTTDQLQIRDSYNIEKDAEFYYTPEKHPARVDVYPGYFVALFLHDAHMPQLIVDGNLTWVKKVVIKVHTSLFNNKSVDKIV